MEQNPENKEEKNEILVRVLKLPQVLITKLFLQKIPQGSFHLNNPIHKHK
jgi:hypothetical protein